MNKTDTKQYIRTAQKLDQMGLHKQADNVESLMRVSMAMSAGTPLFANRREHEEYLELLIEAKEVIASSNASKDAKEVAAQAYVLSEIERYAELWNFMLNHDHNMRRASLSIPFLERFASSGDLTPEQLKLVDVLQPVLKHVWENGIREAFASNTNLVLDDRKLNKSGMALQRQYDSHAIDKDDVSMRKLNLDAKKNLARAQHISGLDEQRDASQIVRAQAEGLMALSNPNAQRVLELLVSKALEPLMLRTNSPDDKQQLAQNAAAVMQWFLEPVKLNKGSMPVVQQKARMIGMPENMTLPPEFFDAPASAEGTNGVRFFDPEEISHLQERAHKDPGASVLTQSTSGAPAPSPEEMPLDEASGPPEPVTTPEELVEPAIAEPTIPEVKPKRRGVPKIEPSVEPSEAMESVVAPEDGGESNIEPDSTLDAELESVNPVDRSDEIDEPTDDEIPSNKQFIQAVIAVFNEGLDESSKKQAAEPEEYEFYTDIYNRFTQSEDPAAIRSLIIELLTKNSGVDAAEVASNVDQLSAEDFLMFRRELLNSEGAATEEEVEHAPGTVEQTPNPLVPGDIQNTEVEEDEEPQEINREEAWNKFGKGVKRKRLGKWLAGLGLGSAAIWSILSQMVPGGAASQAINPQTYTPPQTQESRPIQPEIYQPPAQIPSRPPVVQQSPQVPVQQPQVSQDGTLKNQQEPKVRSRWDFND